MFYSRSSQCKNRDAKLLQISIPNWHIDSHIMYIEILEKTKVKRKVKIKIFFYFPNKYLNLIKLYKK